MLSLFSVEIVSDEEYGAIETSIEIADCLVKSRSTETDQRDLTGVDQSNRPSQDFPSTTDNPTHDKCLDARCSVSAHVPNEDFERKSGSRFHKIEAVEDFDIEDLAARCSGPVRDFNYAEPTPLDLWGRPAVFVTTLCMQEWCEMQLDFSLRYVIGYYWLQSGTVELQQVFLRRHSQVN